MTILNRVEMASAISTNLPTGGSGILAVDHRDVLTDLVSSVGTYIGSMSGGVDGPLAITATPTKISDFTTDDSPANDLFTPDAANDRILVNDPCAVFVNYRLAGEWATNDDLEVEIYLNGIINPSGTIYRKQEGAGAADTQNIIISQRGFIINQFAIDNGTGPSGEAAVEVFWSSATGNFNVDQLDVAFNIIYIPFSIRAVG